MFWGVRRVELVCALLLCSLYTTKIAAAQEGVAQSTSSSLPEIRVIAPSPIAPPRPRPSTPAPNASATKPQAAAATGPQQPEPGVVDRDKIPSNIQTLTAADFDHATAPDLLSAIARSLPGVSL